MSMLTPTFLYSNDVIACCETPPCAKGAKVVTGIGTCSPKRACAVWPSLARSWGLASTRVSASVLSRR